MKLLFSLFFSFLLITTADVSFALQRIPIQGTVNFADQAGIIKFTVDSQQPLVLEVARVSEGNYDVQLAATNWKRELLDLSAVLNGSLKILQSKEGVGTSIQGNISSKYALLKNHPFENMSVDFTFHNGELQIHSFIFSALSASGSVRFNPITEVNMIIKIDGLPMQYLALFVKNMEFSAYGKVSGEIRVQGFSNNLNISGKLVSYNGSFGPHSYHMAQFKFKGIYPIIHIDDSHIDQRDGFSFKVKGNLDLSDLNNLSSQIRNFVSNPLISGEKKDLEWTLKRLQTEQNGSIEFKYMKRGTSSGGEDAGFLGVQHRLKF